MSANVYEELEAIAARFGVTVQYVKDLASSGRLHELTGAAGQRMPFDARTAGSPGRDEIERGITERARILERRRSSFSEGERAKVDTEVRMQRWMRDEVYDVQRGRR